MFKLIFKILKKIIVKIYFLLDKYIHDSHELFKGFMAFLTNFLICNFRPKDIPHVISFMYFYFAIFLIYFYMSLVLLNKFFWFLFVNTTTFTKFYFVSSAIHIQFFMPQLKFDDAHYVKYSNFLFKHVDKLPYWAMIIINIYLFYNYPLLDFLIFGCKLFLYTINSFYNFFYFDFVNNKIFNSQLFLINSTTNFINYISNTFCFVYIFIFFLTFQFLFLCIINFFFFYFNKKKIIYSYLKLNFVCFILSIPFTNFYFSNQINIFFNTKFILGYYNSYWITFDLNEVSLFFSSTVLQIGFFCSIFTFHYMKNEKNLEKFFLLLNFFVFFMIFFVISSNLLCLFLFWELIGITSFFLINFYHLRSITFKSAFKAFTFNRISDVALLIAIIIYWLSNNSFEINDLILKSFIFNNDSINLIFFKIKIYKLFLFFLTISIFCKSTQLGFHYWLPDSMEAPAPASALIHSATLVSAGILLFYKFNILYFNFISLSSIILLITSTTVLFGSIVSFHQTDLKKILAYSTISNCGLIFCAIILTNKYNFLSIFYFHGLNKSLAFLIVGFIIINNSHYQDIRQVSYKNNKNVLAIFIYVLIQLSAWPIAYITIFKHNILYSNINFFCKNISIYIILLSSLFSLCYSMKIIFVLFKPLLNFKNNKHIYNKFSLNIINMYFLYSIFSILMYMYFGEYKSQNVYSFKNVLFINNVSLYMFIVSVFISYNYFKNNGFNKKIIMIFFVFILIKNLNFYSFYFYDKLTE